METKTTKYIAEYEEDADKEWVALDEHKKELIEAEKNVLDDFEYQYLIYADKFSEKDKILIERIIKEVKERSLVSSKKLEGCSACFGEGKNPFDKRVKCQFCNGSGMVKKKEQKESVFFNNKELVKSVGKQKEMKQE